MKASDYVAEFLVAQGVTHVFEVVGGMITHLVDSLHRGRRVELVSVHHEQAAAFAADAMGRARGVPGVAMATSGPGAVNLLTGVDSCHFDSSPAVFITGQVNRAELKGARGVRQLGFQETDVAAMAAPITKWAVRVRSARELPRTLERAFRAALSGRPGPVLVDIPMDVQRERVLARSPVQVAPVAPKGAGAGDVGELLDGLASARRPLLLAGGGVRSSRSVAEFRRCVSALGAPVVHSLMAVDALPWGHPLRVGMIGSYGNRWANLAVGRSDLLWVLGSRLDIRQTGSEAAWLGKGRRIVHIDCDASEINNRVTGCRAVHAHLRPFLERVAETAQRRPFPDRSAWLRELAELRSRWPETREYGRVPGINPNRFMQALSAASGGAAVFVADVGQHQMWAGQSLRLASGQRFLTSGGMGAMGFALPGAVGAALSLPGRPMVVVAGDGGFQLNIQELETVAHRRLPVKMVILDNGCQGMVRQFQQSYFGGRYASTWWGYSTPEFEKVARAYGIGAAVVAKPGEVGAGLRRLWRDPAVPYLLRVRISPLGNVYPKMAFGRPMTEMEPQVRPVEMEGT